MVLCWPWAQLDPFGNPLEAAQAAGRGGDLVFFGGALTTAGQLPRLHAPWLLALTLPASYFVAGVLGAWRIVVVLRHKPLPAETWTKLSHFGWLLSVCLLPLLWTVLSGIPVPDRSSLLFVVPVLAALAGASATWWLRSPLPAAVRVGGSLLLAAALGVAVADMLALHPYEAVYFNRLLAGGLARAGQLYETDQAGASYAEGLLWVSARVRPDDDRRARARGRSDGPGAADVLPGQQRRAAAPLRGGLARAGPAPRPRDDLAPRGRAHARPRGTRRRAAGLAAAEGVRAEAAAAVAAAARRLDYVRG